MIGGIAWISSLVYAGYVFGNIPWVKQNLTLIVLAIVAISLLPAISTFIKERRPRAETPAERDAEGARVAAIGSHASPATKRRLAIRAPLRSGARAPPPCRCRWRA